MIATHPTIKATGINRPIAPTPQRDSDAGQFESLARFAREQGIGFGVVLEGLGLGVPRELAAHLQGDVPQVAGIGGPVGDHDVAGWQGTRLEADERCWVPTAMILLYFLAAAIIALPSATLCATGFST